MIENGESIEKNMEERKFKKNIAKHQSYYNIILVFMNIYNSLLINKIFN